MSNTWQGSRYLQLICQQIYYDSNPVLHLMRHEGEVFVVNQKKHAFDNVAFYIENFCNFILIQGLFFGCDVIFHIILCIL